MGGGGAGVICTWSCSGLCDGWVAECQQVAGRGVLEERQENFALGHAQGLMMAGWR